MRVAIVHYWLVSMRGGEKVVEALCEMFPDADIFTNVLVEEQISETIKSHRITTTFINRLPWARRFYRHYVGLMPIALEQLDLSGYDLVISSESGPAKGVLVDPTSLHVCYCHTPMRYLWDMYPFYISQAGPVSGWFMKLVFHKLRYWDVITAARVDEFVSNSAFVAARIEKTYRRKAQVIPPPVSVERFQPSSAREDYYLVVGQLVSYKRVDIVVESFRNSSRTLIVIGNGDQLSKLQKGTGANITFLTNQSDESVRDHLARCRALIFPGVEDFGIVPIEAMASGTPVIAYRAGGALETVVENETGVFFDEQTSENLTSAIERFEELPEGTFNPEQMHTMAEQYSKGAFKTRMHEFLRSIQPEFVQES